MQPTITQSVTRFRAKKGKYLRIFNWVYLALFLGLIGYELWFAETTNPSDYILSGIWFVYFLVQMHRWRNTYYELQGDVFFYRSGFSKGRIPVNTIRKIEPESKVIGDFKAALSGKGLLLMYHKYDEVFIAPENPDVLMEALLKINPEIEVKMPERKFADA